MKKYKIYRNLHKNCFSVLKYIPQIKGYRLHEHITEAYLYNVEAKVSESGRQKVIKEKQKNVHAFLLCTNYRKEDMPIYGHPYFPEIYYNPYKYDTFVVNFEPFESAKRVMLTLTAGTPKAFLMEK